MVRTARDLLEVIAAILLGLVSVMTTFGAYQAAAWSNRADELAAISQQLRDRNLTQFITSQLVLKDDGAKLLEVVALESELLVFPDREAAVRAQQETIIASASPELAADWAVWKSCGFCADQVPMTSSAYETARYAAPISMQIAGYVADAESDAVAAKAGGITVAAIVFAIALFLLGVAAAAASVRVVGVLVAGGAIVFVVGSVLTVVALA